MITIQIIVEHLLYGVTDQEDNVKEWTQTYKLSPQKTLSTHIRSKISICFKEGTVNRYTFH